MDVRKALLGLTLSLLLGSGVVVAADSDKGVTAFNSRDYKSAFAELMPLAKKGDGRSQLFIGLMYDSGWGVLQNDKQAVKWYTLAAEQGDAYAQGNLGVMYDNGRGVLENDKTAVKWYTLAAEQGDANAQFNLALKYDNGEGVLENDKTAIKWYTKAAEQGHAKAQANLGAMYANGEGVLTDIKRAYMWYSIGSYNGNEIGGENKDKIAKDMTSAQIDKAQDMSSRCLDSGYTDC